MKIKEIQISSNQGNNDERVTDPITKISIEFHNVILDNSIASKAKVVYRAYKK